MTDRSCEHELPEEFRLANADHGETIECAECDVAWEVLVNEITGERWLVRTEVTQPRTRREHPVVLGVAATVATMAAFLTPIVLSATAVPFVLEAAPEAHVWGLGFAFGAIGMMISWYALRALYWHTAVGRWFYTWDRWTETRGVRNA